MEAESEL